ncbi:GNAT family protein [Actinosynnema sp. NPDC047251]|uniref:GNAT family N-acetyltransferase n=1 Tax=Saccharothrix espanaensis TaxID=103731 RepID=UPI00059D0DED|nr:GNAT family protein [Saccharothrix espanaensis]
MRARRVELRPGVAADGLLFYQLLLRVGVENLPPPARVAGQFFDNSAALFRIQRRGSGEVIGYATLRELGQAGHVRLAVYVEKDKSRHGVSGEALYLVVNYAFAAYDVDRILCRTTEESFAYVRGAGDDDQKPIGIFPGHRYFRGRLLDLHHFLVMRDEWTAFWNDAEHHIVGPGRSVTAAGT